MHIGFSSSGIEKRSCDQPAEFPVSFVFSLNSPVGPRKVVSCRNIIVNKASSGSELLQILSSKSRPVFQSHGKIPRNRFSKDIHERDSRRDCQVCLSKKLPSTLPSISRNIFHGMAKERNSAPRIFRTYFLADMSVSPTTARGLWAFASRKGMMPMV